MNAHELRAAKIKLALWLILAAIDIAVIWTVPL